MKRYGLWKYILILIVLSFGVIYSLPNLYSPDQAVQVSYNSSSKSVDLNLRERIQSVLDSDSSPSIVEMNEDYILVRLENYEDQLKIKDLLSSNLGSDVIVALNLAPTTPEWMRAIGGEPMTLGLDLIGGVHFLMQVDTQAAIKNRQNGSLQSIRLALKDEDIRFGNTYVDEDLSIVLSFRDKRNKDRAYSYITDNYAEFIITQDLDSQDVIRIVLSEEQI